MKRMWMGALVGWLILSGCADRQPISEEAGFDQAVAPIGSYTEYKLVWQAMYKVLQERFLIRVSRYEDGYIFATSRVRYEGGLTARVKIVGQVVENEEGFFEPQVRVLEQADLSVPKVHARAIYQPTHQWRNLGFDRGMEVEIANAIEAELLGRKNPFTGSPARNLRPPGEGSSSPERLAPAEDSLAGSW